MAWELTIFAPTRLCMMKLRISVSRHERLVAGALWSADLGIFQVFEESSVSLFGDND